MTEALQGFETLQAAVRHATAVAGLAYHRRDPFDRLLLAQATIEGMTLVSTDAALKPDRVSLPKA